MDLSISQRALDLAARTAAFVAEHVEPLESALESAPLAADVLAGVRARAKTDGLWAPQLPEELGGQGLDILDACPVLEAAGRSLLGALCLGCSAPDEGNAHLLHIAGSPAQRERYLGPLARGEIRSAFAMTEPAPGAGSDPRMMRSRATKDGDAWVLEADKWFTSGAAGARFLIVACLSDPDAPVRTSMTLFLVDNDHPGVEILREIPTLGVASPGGHCEVRLRACRVEPDAVLGQVGAGYSLMQKRLGPARLTHCMRWLGVATRALEIARDRAATREGFGKPLGEHQGVAWPLADSATELHASRLMVHAAAWRLRQGDQARIETSMCKVFVAETVHRVIDRAVQICGSLGISRDLPLASMYEEARAFRIYDGPSEVHRMVIARDLLRSAGSPVRPSGQRNARPGPT